MTLEAAPAVQDSVPALVRVLRDRIAVLESVARGRESALATMSHDLRTPLTAILGFTGTLLMQLAGPLNDEQVRQLQTVEQSAHRLLAMIDRIAPGDGRSVWPAS